MRSHENKLLDVANMSDEVFENLCDGAGKFLFETISSYCSWQFTQICFKTDNPPRMHGCLKFTKQKVSVISAKINEIKEINRQNDQK